MGNRTSAPAERRDALSRDTPLSRAAARAVQLFPAALAYELAALRRGEKTAAISYRLRSPPQAYEPLVRGWVDKYSQGTETWRRRFCVIMPSGTLQYFDREVESGSPAAGSVDLVGYIVTDEMTATGEPVLRLASFIPGRRDYTFRFAFADERQTWKSALRCAIRAGVPPLSSMPGEASAFRRLIEVMRGDFGLDTTPRIDRREVDALASLFVHIAADTGVAGARNTITAATRAARTAAAGAWSVASSRADALRPALQRLLDANASAVANALSSSSATAVALVSAALKDTRIQEKSANHAEAVTMALLLPLCEAHAAAESWWLRRVTEITARGSREDDLCRLYMDAQWRDVQLGGAVDSTLLVVGAATSIAGTASGNRSASSIRESQRFFPKFVRDAVIPNADADADAIHVAVACELADDVERTIRALLCAATYELAALLERSADLAAPAASTVRRVYEMLQDDSTDRIRERMHDVVRNALILPVRGVVRATPESQAFVMRSIYGERHETGTAGLTTASERRTSAENNLLRESSEPTANRTARAPRNAEVSRSSQVDAELLSSPLDLVFGDPELMIDVAVLAECERLANEALSNDLHDAIFQCLAAAREDAHS